MDRDENVGSVRNSESNDNMEVSALMEDMAEDENQKKRIRHRRRKVYESIRKQMEFYFSDANLAKDRFLNKLIEDDPEVDLAIFLRFNKIRQLTDNIKDIKKALKHSEILSVRDDGTKVFRTKPVQQKENEDECTIYVEKLPLEADHDWLVQVFSQYGTVDYVSIPKYRSTGKIKGFAFVEFHTPEDAQNTLEVFGAVGCCLSSNIEPEKLCSIATFENEDGVGKQPQQFDDSSSSYVQKRPLENGGEKMTLNEDGDVKVVKLEEEGENEKAKRMKKKEKQTHKISDDMECDKREEKGKGKQNYSEDTAKSTEQEEDPSDKNETKGKRKRKSMEDVLNIEEEEVLSGNDKKDMRRQEKHVDVTKSDEEEAVFGKDEKKRKRKRKHADSIGRSEEDEDDLSGVGKEKKKQIDVLELEKRSVEVEKPNKRKRQVEVGTVEGGIDVPEKKARLESDAEKEQEVTDTENDVPENEVRKKKKSRYRKKKRKQIAQEVSSLGLQVLSKTEWKRLRNKYLNLQRATMKNLKQQLFRTRMWDARSSHSNGYSQHSEQTNEAVSGEAPKTTAPRFSFSPGVIVHVRLDAAVSDVKKFKTEAKSHGDIQYVDVEEGATEAFIRCSTAEAAKQLVSAKPWEEMAVLDGEEDLQYWGRIHEWREQVINRQRKKRRGKDKLLARAEKALSKHIKFDETV